MSYNLATLQSGNATVVLNPNAKNLKTGSLAMGVMHGSKDTRNAIGQGLYAHWLTAGIYRPIINDIVFTSGIIPKAAQPFVARMIPPGKENVKREELMNLCSAVRDYVQSERSRKLAEGKEVKEFKGIRATVYALVERLAEGEKPSDLVVDMA